MSRVVVVGSINIDTILHVKKHPAVGETVSATSSGSSPGGKGSNQAVAAATAGARVSLVSAVGYDGDRYIRHLEASGVNTEHVARHGEVQTGAAVVIVSEDGDNSIITSPGANACLTQVDLSTIGLEPGDVVVVQFELPYETVLSAMRYAARVGATIILNPSPWREDAVEALSMADIVIVNEIEAAALTVGLAEGALVTTLGPRGATWRNLHVQPPAITAIDTTGAGDSFAGTLAGAIAAGRGMEQALEAAVLAATEACASPGAQTWRAESR